MFAGAREHMTLEGSILIFPWVLPSPHSKAKIILKYKVITYWISGLSPSLEN